MSRARFEARMLHSLMVDNMSYKDYMDVVAARRQQAESSSAAMGAHTESSSAATGAQAGQD